MPLELKDYQEIEKRVREEGIDDLTFFCYNLT